MTRILIFIVLLTGCKNETIDHYGQSEDELLKDSIEYAEYLNSQKQHGKKWKYYENKQLELIGLINPDSIELEKNEILYQFKTIGKHSSYYEVIEILDKYNSNEITCQKIKYSINLDCHPDMGKKQIDNSCITIINKKKYNLNSEVLDSLSKYLVAREFWELNLDVSEYRTHNVVRFYHGIFLDYTATYPLTYPTESGVDTFINKQHRVIRAPMDSKIMSDLSNVVEQALKNKMPDDNKRR